MKAIRWYGPVLGLGLAIPAAADEVQFADGDFFNPSWIAVKIYDDTPGQAATFSVSRSDEDGNPGAFRQVTHTYAHGSIFVGHRKVSATYNPSAQGPIEALVFSFDLKLIEFGAAYLAYLVQDGHHYRTGIAVPSDQLSWTSDESVPLYAECFGVVGSGPVHPNFSASGAPITFGYCTGNTSDSEVGTTVSGIDNWRVTVNPAGICPADTNLDGVVGLEDLTQLLSRFGDDDLYAGQGSLDCDRDVDLADLAILLSDFGRQCLP